MSTPQTRLQSILEQLEGAYKTSPVPTNSGQGLPNGMSEVSKRVDTPSPAPVDPRMTQILEELEGAYSSNYQIIKPGALPPAVNPETGGVLDAAGQAVHTIGAGGWQGLAGWVDTADKLYDQLLRREYQNRYAAIVKQRPAGYETMTPQQESQAKLKLFDVLGPPDEWIKGRKVQLLANARDALLKQAQAHAAAGLPMTDNKVLDVARQVYQGLGQAAVDVPVYAMGGPAALPVFGAAKGYAEKGTAEGAVLGGVEGSMLQTMIRAVGLLPTGVQLPTWFGFGAATTPGNVQDRVVGGLTWAGLGVSGQKGKDPVTLREFIERYPRWQKRVDDAAAAKVLKTLAPDITPEIIESYGGGKAMLNRLVGLKDKFAAVMAVFNKSGNDPKALEAALNQPEMAPLFRDLMGATEAKPLALPERTPSSPARFQVTPEGEVAGTKFPEDLLIRIQYREQELGRRMTPEEMAAFFEAQRPAAPAAAPAAKPAEAPKPEAKPKAPEKPAAAAKSDMEIQMMPAEEAAKADVDDFKRWANPRFRLSYDPTNASDMAAYNDLVKALGLRGDGTILEDVSRRLKAPSKPPTDSTPQAPPAAPAPSTPPPAAPSTPPAPAPAAAAPAKPKGNVTTGKRDQLRRPPTTTPLLTWIRRVGGIQIDENVQKLRKGELLSIQDSKWRRLFRKRGGVNIFKLQEMAREDGRLRSQDENEFWEAIENEVAGRSSYYSDAERQTFGEDVNEPRERTAEDYRAEAVDDALQAWLNGREVQGELTKDVEAEVAKSDDAEALRRQRAENLKRNELLDALEKEGQLRKTEIDEFLDDTYHDGKKARELAREVMDGKLPEDEAKAELKRRVDDMVTDFRPEDFERGGDEEPLPPGADLGEGKAEPAPRGVASPVESYRKLLAEAEGQKKKADDLAAKAKGSSVAAEAEARAKETEAVTQRLKDLIAAEEAKIADVKGPRLEPDDTPETLKEKLVDGLVLFHGHGVPKEGERFNAGAGSFGRGKSYTSSATAAKVYGEVAAEKVTLKNPLIVSTEKAQRLANQYGTREGTPEQRLNAAQAITTDLLAKGHDGLVRLVEGPDGEIQEVEVTDYTPYLAKGKPAAATTPKVAEEGKPFTLAQESFSKPKAPESTQGSLFEPNKVEKTYPPGFDNRGMGTWPDQESMKRDLRPLVHQGWVAEYGESKDGKVWARLVERRTAGEGELKTEGIKPPEFGEKTSEDPQLSLDDEISGSLPLDKAEPVKPSAGVEVKQPGEKTEEEDFEGWYKALEEDYDRAIASMPKGQVKAFKLYIADDTGTDRFYGNFPEEARAEVLAYAKEKGVEGKVKLGPAFNAKAENVDQSNALEVPKDLIDWVAETGGLDIKAESAKYEREVLGEDKDSDPEKEVFAGIGPSKSVRQKIAKAFEKLDVEALFNRLKAKATGLSVKLYHTRKNREFELTEKAVDSLKKLARQTNGGKDLSPAEYQRIFILASKPRAFAALSEADKARLGPIVRSVRSFFDNYVPRLREAGVIEDPWPLSAIKRMRAEVLDYRERVGRGARNSDALNDLIAERERAIKFLETTGMRYVHIPRYWLEAFFNARPAQAPRVFSELFGQRDTLDIEWLAHKLVVDGMIQPTDLDVRRIMLMYSHSAGHKIALGQIIKDAKSEGLILSAEEAPENWPRLSPQAFPSLRGYRMNPEMLDFLERNYLNPKMGMWTNPTVGNVLGITKMLQFYNPINLSQYSLIQTAWTGAVTSLKAPKVFAKAAADITKKTPDYWEAYQWGAFPEPYSPSFRMAAARTRQILGEDPLLKKVARTLNPYQFGWNLAWKMENYFKMASYNHLREKGFSPREAAQIAAKTGGDYATLPPTTRKALNRFLFTPSFTIAMMKAQGEMAVAGLKMMAKPKLLFEKTGDAKYLRQMAKGAVFLTGGLVLKNMLMHKLGYKTDVLGLKWSKTIEDEDGNERDLVVHMAAPDNVILRYLNDLMIVGKSDQKATAIWNRATWKLHPVWVTTLELLQNKRIDGTPVWNPWEPEFEKRKKGLVYAIRRIVRISELLPEQGGGNLSKLKAMKALREDLGTIGGQVLAMFSIPYMRSTADRRLMYEMNNLLDVFKQANKATPPKNDAEADERAQWLQDTLDKIRQRIEEIQDK